MVVKPPALVPLPMPADNRSASDADRDVPEAGAGSGDRPDQSLAPAAPALPPSPIPTQPGRLEYLEGLVDAASAINATLDQATVCQVLVDRATDLLGVPAAAVLLLDEPHDPVYGPISLSGGGHKGGLAGGSGSGAAGQQQQIRLPRPKGCRTITWPPSGPRR
jgi:hypothetical protein